MAQTENGEMVGQFCVLPQQQVDTIQSHRSLSKYSNLLSSEALLLFTIHFRRIVHKII